MQAPLRRLGTNMPLHIAAHGDIEVVHALLGAGAQVEAEAAEVKHHFCVRNYVATRPSKRRCAQPGVHQQDCSDGETVIWQASRRKTKKQRVDEEEKAQQEAR